MVKTNEIIEFKEVKNNTYSCEICGTTYETPSKAYRCERACKEKSCKHESVEYGFDFNFEYETYKYCVDCGKVLESYKIENTIFEDEVNKMVFEYIKKKEDNNG